MREIDQLDFDPGRAVQNAKRFSVDAFQGRLAEQVELAVQRRDEAPVSAVAGEARLPAPIPSFSQADTNDLPIAAFQANELGARPQRTSIATR